MDVQLTSTGDIYFTKENDTILFKSETDEEILIIKRAILSPLGHLKRYYFNGVSPVTIDSNYGNPLYLELAKPFTLSWVSNCRDIILEVLKSLTLKGTIGEVDVQITGIDSIGINIQYSGNFIQLTI